MFTMKIGPDARKRPDCRPLAGDYVPIGFSQLRDVVNDWKPESRTLPVQRTLQLVAPVSGKYQVCVRIDEAGDDRAVRPIEDRCPVGEADPFAHLRHHCVRALAPGNDRCMRRSHHVRCHAGDQEDGIRLGDQPA